MRGGEKTLVKCAGCGKDIPRGKEIIVKGKSYCSVCARKAKK